MVKNKKRQPLLRDVRNSIAATTTPNVSVPNNNNAVGSKNERAEHRRAIVTATRN
jgi:hypothetical protein